MPEGLSEFQHTGNRALAKAEESQLAVIELQRELKLAVEELGYLKTFSRRLLRILKQQLHLEDHELDGLLLQTEEAQQRLAEEPGTRLAPLCPFCERPMQQDSRACIYCGKAVA